MLPSRYLKIWPGDTESGSWLGYSTRRAAVASIPAAAGEALLRGVAPRTGTDTLAGLGFLVPDPETEMAAVSDYLAELNRVSRVVRAAVVLGMGCNFACPYCYEGSLKGADAMTPATAKRLVEFLSFRLTPDKSRLALDFYGGEPLFYRERIRQIAAAARGAAQRRGVSFSFTLVSNGSLLTPEMADELLPLGFSGVKVTLDGPPELHNRSRPLRNGQATFATIIENLRACCDRVRIGVSGNYTRENWPRFVELLDYLEGVGLGPDRLAGVKFDPVLQVRGRFADPSYCSGCSSNDEPWLVDAGLHLREEILRRGYHTPKIIPSPCMVDRDDAFTVNWDGTLTKCPDQIGHEEFAVGDIWNGFTAEVENTFGGPRWKAEEKCRGCTYLPLCFGGCRYMQFQREGNMTGVECQKDFFDATLEPMIRQDVEYRWGRAEPL